MRPLLILLLIPALFTSFDRRHRAKVKLPREFVAIPAGTFWVADGDSSKRVLIDAFYMSKFEVTNLQYRTFYNEVFPVLTETEKANIAYHGVGWKQVTGDSTPLMEYYYSHPSYNHHPVVNISYDGAVHYCKWLQKKLAAANPDHDIEVKLPGREQWMYAASGGRSQAMYPWGNFYLRNRKGEFLCNFRRVGDQAIVRNRETGKPEVNEGIGDASLAFFTATVKSFYPNDYGLYNMSGNVAEMTSKRNLCVGGSWNDYGGDVQIASKAFYGSFAATVGFRPIIIVKLKG